MIDPTYMENFKKLTFNNFSLQIFKNVDYFFLSFRIITSIVYLKSNNSLTLYTHVSPSSSDIFLDATF